MPLPVSRRNLLFQAAGALGAAGNREEPVAFSDYSARFRVEAQARNPRIKAYDLRQLVDWMTPEKDFFTFHQGAVPAVDPSAWKLRVGGAVERPAEFSLDDLRRRVNRRDVAVTLECAGNSGQPELMNGLVGNAVWSGPGLASILKECGVKPEAQEVVFLGLDSQKEAKWQAADLAVEFPHGRSIFVQDALAPEPLLALEMNGAPLSPERGFPVRLILPGWYGMGNVKWLSRIEVLDRRYEGRQMARNYHALRTADADGRVWLDTSISRNRIKSVIARVARVPAESGFAWRIDGAAWGGGARIEAVEMRIDGGDWRNARIGRRGDPFGWLLWSLRTEAAGGRRTLISRAINAAGEMQPTHEELRRRVASFREDHSQWPRLITT